MKKGTIYEGIVKELKFPNQGVVEINDGKAVVKNTIPGQKIRCAVTKVRKGKAEGRLLEILEPSPLETVRDICPHFGVCGGCGIQGGEIWKNITIIPAARPAAETTIKIPETGRAC